MKILIVSGFLGAGKTTFIKRLARNVDQRFAILENEYGAAGIDGARLGQNQQGTQKNVWEMTEQCICCTGKKDFAASVLTIANVVDPESLIVEPTGVGSLAQIIENLRQIEYERIQLLSPVTIVDVYSYRHYMAEYPELYQDQIRSADTIVVSKTEACQAEEKQRIQEFLQEINPQAKIITDYASTMTREDYQSLLLGGRYEKEVQDTQSGEKMPETFSFENIRMEAPEILWCFLEQIIRGTFGNVIRAKGQFAAGDQFLQFDVADHRYSITGTEQKNAGQAVFIGNDMNEDAIRQYFKKCAGNQKMKYAARHAS